MSDAHAVDAHQAASGRMRPLALAFATLAPPLAWALHLNVNYAISSHACFPAFQPRLTPLPGFSWFWALLICVDVVSIGVGIASMFIAYRAWTDARPVGSETVTHIVATGEERARFLAGWGLLIGGGFVLAILFDFVGLWIVPKCG